MKNISLLLSSALIAFLALSCKKKETTELTTNYISYNGKKTELLYNELQTKFTDDSCWSFNSMGGIVQNKTAGIRLQFYNRDIVLYLKLYGESAGKYSQVTSFCNDFKIQSSSMAYTHDGVRVQFVGGDSEVEITSKAQGKISGNFKIRVQYDKNFVNDSFITGKFENIPLRDKI